ncbi:MAG: hypothetical protein ABSF23_09055 [Terracidiphilus sp.]
MNLDNALWFAYIGVEAVFVGLLCYKRVWRIFPVFLSYCIWDILSNLTAYTVLSVHPARYFDTVFVESIVDSALLFCVLVELTWSVLRPLRASLSRRALVVVAVLILIVGAVIWPFASYPGLAHVTTREGLLFAQLQQTVSILRILFFLLMAGGSQWLSIGWRDRELQVATGLGFYSIASLTATVLETHQVSESQYYHLSQIAPAGFLCSMLYWLVSFAQKEAERRQFTPQMQSLLLAVAGAARSTRVALNEAPPTKLRKRDGE